MMTTDATIVTHSKIVAHPTKKEIDFRQRAGARIEAQTYCPPAEGYAADSSASVAAMNMLMIEVPISPYRMTGVPPWPRPMTWHQYRWMGDLQSYCSWLPIHYKLYH